MDRLLARCDAGDPVPVSGFMGKPKASSYKRRIAARFFVRFHMSLILAAVIASGVGISKLLMEAGLADVRARYPLAVVASYLVFLALVRLWIWYVDPTRERASSGLDWSDIPDPTVSCGPPEVLPRFGGGSSGGGGASSRWAASDPPAPSSNGGAGGSWLPDLDIDLEDGFWILLVLAILVGLIFGLAGYLLYIAPELLPEAAFQAALASGLVRASRREDSSGWVGGVIKSTAIPFLLVLTVTCALAFTMHGTCPGARRLADALACSESAAQ